MEITRSLIHSTSHMSEIKWSAIGLWSLCCRAHDLALFLETPVTHSPSPHPRVVLPFHSLNWPISPCGATSNQVLHQQGGWWASNCLTWITLHGPIWPSFAFQKYHPRTPFSFGLPPFSFYLWLIFILTPQNMSLTQNGLSRSYMLWVGYMCFFTFGSVTVCRSFSHVCL